MKRSSSGIWKLLVAFTFCSVISRPSFAQHAMQQIDSLLSNYYHPGEPGAAVIIQQRGKTIFNKCYGTRELGSGAAITNHTNFNIASITKQFTAMGILQLVAQHKINLDDKLVKFFPDFHGAPGKIITVRHLLTHSSGIMDHYDHVNTTKLMHAYDKDVLQAVQGLDSTYFTPGTSYRYSNTAYCILAMIIEKVSGMKYEDYMQKNIFTPLGMKNTSVWHEDAKISNRAIGYDFDSTTKKFVRADADESVFFSTQGDGGMYCSIDEYLKWIAALQNPTVLPKESIKQARSLQFSIDKDRKLGYGFGWFVAEKESPTVVYHTGSNGGFRGLSFTIPQEDYVIVIFSNRTGIDLEQVGIEINKILRVKSNSFVKLESLISFQECWPIFAPCKKTLSYLTSYIKSWSVSVMALN